MEFVGDLGVAILGAVAAFGLGWWAQQYGVKDAELLSRLDEICRDIVVLEEKALRYWALDARTHADEAEWLAIEIQALDYRVGEYIAYIAEERWHVKDLADEPLFDFRDAVTGGDFQVRDRPAEPERRSLIVAASTRLILDLRRSRRMLFKAWLD